MTYICPKCHKSLKNKHSLAEHTKRFHGQVVATLAPIPNLKPTSKTVAKKFEVKPVKEKPPAKASYKCGGCGASLDGEISPCPSCGVGLTWS